jgi:DegV family protein with EDD domain
VSEIAVVTDSSSLLSAPAANVLRIEVVPVTVAVDGHPVDEAEPIDRFYERMRAGGRATTSQPNPAQFAETYARVARRGARAIVSVHLDARASGVPRSAALAAGTAAVETHVVDTRTVSYGVGVCARCAARTAARGAPAGDIVAEVSALGASMRNAFAVRNAPGGRVPAQGELQVLSFQDGVALPVGERGTVGGAVEAMTHLVRDSRALAAAVGHAGREVEAGADALAHALVASPGVAAVERYRVGASVGAHTGPETFGVFWWPVGYS